MSNMLKKIALLVLCTCSLAANSSACTPQEAAKPATAKAASKTGKTGEKAPKTGKAALSKVKAAQAKADKEMAAEATAQDAGTERKPAEGEQAAPSDPMQTMRAFIAGLTLDKMLPNWRQTVVKPPKLTFPADKKYFWNLETSEGTIKIELFTKVAPMHASSTIYLTELGFYDGLTFHRVIDGFMAQGGCPLGTGIGGPAYKYRGEFDPRVTHDRPGLLSMANTGTDGTDGSQFFITFKATHHLDNKHTLFGEVKDGMPVVKTLEANGSQSGKPKKNMWIVKATISVEDAPPAEAPATPETPKAE